MFILIICVMTNILFPIRFLIDDIIYHVKFVTLSLLLIKRSGEDYLACIIYDFDN